MRSEALSPGLKNLRGGSPVSLCLRGREVQGLAEPISEDKPVVAACLTEHLRKSAFDARFYNVAIDEKGNPMAKDLEQAVQTVTMIRVRFV
jgi:hypothetical protein